MKDRRKFLLWKQEVTEGTDPGLVAADAIRTTGLTITPYAGNRVSLEYDKGNFGSSATINVNPYTRIQFGVYLASSGAAGTAPQWNELLESCGFSETINAGVSAVYDSISASIPSGTGYFLQPEDAGVNDLVLESNGMRGNASLSIQAGQLPVINFDLMGSYVTPVTAASVTADYTGWIDPIPATVDNTPTFTLDGYSACLQSLTHNCNNQVIYENIVGCSGCRITDANYGGTMTIKAPDLGTKNFFTALIESHTAVNTGVVQIVHGTTAGYIIQADYATVQISDVTMTQINGDVAFQFNFLDIDNSLSLTAK